MSNHETVEDVLQEMRNDAHNCSKFGGAIESVGEDVGRYADRLERALAADRSLAAGKAQHVALLDKRGDEILCHDVPKFSRELADGHYRLYTSPPADHSRCSARLYNAINHLMAQIGCHGEINSKAPECAEVMAALAEIDGGIYRPADPAKAVAWVEVVNREEGPYHSHGLQLLCQGRHNLYATPRASAPEVTPDIMRIPAGDKLDAIIVYFEDEAAGKGRMTVACYGDAWTAWWGSMGERTVRQFVSGTDPGYLSGALLQLRAANAMHREYTWRVAARVIAALQEQSHD